MTASGDPIIYWIRPPSLFLSPCFSTPSLIPLYIMFVILNLALFSSPIFEMGSSLFWYLLAIVAGTMLLNRLTYLLANRRPLQAARVRLWVAIVAAAVGTSSSSGIASNFHFEIIFGEMINNVATRPVLILANAIVLSWFMLVYCACPDIPWILPVEPYRRWRRVEADQCPRCGYLLLDAERCAECGLDWNPIIALRSMGFSVPHIANRSESSAQKDTPAM